MTGAARRALVAALVLALIASPVAGAAAPVSSAASPVADAVTTASAADERPEFDESIVTAIQGEVADIAVTVPDAADETFTVTVGGDGGFHAAATVTDADGDGSVTLELDTAKAGTGDPDSYIGVSDGDAVENATEHSGGEGPPLAPERYDLTIGSLAEPDSIATLVVQDRGHLKETPTATPEDASTAAPETTTAGDDGTIVRYEGDRLTLASAPNQTIRGETDLPPGTTLGVRLQSTDASSPFLQTPQATVAEDGTFAAEADMSDVEPGAGFEVHVRHDGETLATVDGVVGACDDGECSGTATPGGATVTPADPARTHTPLSSDEIDVGRVTETPRNGTARVPVAFGDAEALTVVIGESDVNYELTATVRDANGDGHAFLLFRTAHAADADRPTLLVEEGGESRPAEITDESPADAPLAPGDYPIDVFRGIGTDGDPAVIGTIAVLDGDGASAATPTASGSLLNAETRDAGLPAGALGALGLGVVLTLLGLGLFFGRFRD